MTALRIGRRKVLRILSGISGGLLSGFGLGDPTDLRAQTKTPDWTSLKSNLHGRVIPRDSADYETSRRMVWNAVKPQRFPAAIVQAGSEADVRESIRFALKHKLKVAARGGGHNWHNAALREGSLLVDLSRLNEVRVDAQNRKATVQPGVKGSALIAELAPHGLAFPIVHGGDVSLSGFLLNGGLGWNYRVWGPSCASIDAVDLVNARGESLRADRDHNADLFWAARGAGPGFFAVVTRFHLKVHPLPNAMLRTTVAYPIDDMERVAAWLSSLGPLAANVEVACHFSGGSMSISATAFGETVAAAHEALLPLDAEPAGVKTLRKNLHQEVSVETVFGRVRAGFQEGPRYYGDTMWSSASPHDLVSAARTGIMSAPPGSTLTFVLLTRGQSGSPQPDMAFSISGSTYVHAHAIWKDDAEAEANRAWVRQTVSSLEPLKAGYYVGEADLAIAPDRARQCYSAVAWDKLMRLKRKYDPDDVFFSYLQ